MEQESRLEGWHHHASGGTCLQVYWYCHLTEKAHVLKGLV